jgi:hypothetical protein
MAAGPCVAEGACEGVKPSRCPPAGPQVIIMRNAAAPEIEGSLRGNTWINSRRGRDTAEPPAFPPSLPAGEWP